MLLQNYFNRCLGWDSRYEQLTDYNRYRPIVSGLVIGLILGDVQKGLIVGGKFWS